MLRRCTTDRLTLWLVARRQLCLRVRLSDSEGQYLDREVHPSEQQVLRVGQHAWLYLIELSLDTPLPTDTRLSYDVGLSSDPAEEPRWIADWAPHLCYRGDLTPGFTLCSRATRVLHGSCRRPHHKARDGLARVDHELQKAREEGSPPALLMLTGDQVYVDDVAGPMLHAIHCVIQRLGLYEEQLEGASVDSSAELGSLAHGYYHREKLLPSTQSNESLAERFFGGVRKPVFTTAHAGNHLISFAEVFAMYLLVWSPAPWALVSSIEPVSREPELSRYRDEKVNIEAFRETLPQAARALANIPVYMIFDDHDVTDDWNLSALWEQTAYEHPFSRRIIGNALLGYLLCQGWGNRPEHVSELMPTCQDLFESSPQTHTLDKEQQNALIDRLLAFGHWHFTLDTKPKIIVLDTRTHRWRSEIRPGHPSGLMDWESLTDFQQSVMGEESVLVVSPAPIFGVKLIEMIQQVFTWFGKPLLVDAENWMAHRGAANVLLNIFGHSRTPKHFMIVSGDVHYSFAYDVRLRHKQNGPHIWQITSSGIKNEFPHGLLEWLDRLNRWLYSPLSPLNWFTKRRRMRVSPRLPRGRDLGERLWNNAGIGDLHISSDGKPVLISQLGADHNDTVFEYREEGRFETEAHPKQ
ncbi:alkaline phosphatase D family protein [uncultured Marinimicrobium sp.]|uniref:alkaline phosphatase D family protein n=2 Tax=Marinimicrobium TaxID=359337 RepID=UPI0030D7D15F